MCSRHPEEGAGASYVEPTGYVQRRDILDVLPEPRPEGIIPEWAVPQIVDWLDRWTEEVKARHENRLTWQQRSQYGGWDRPREEVSEDAKG